MYQRTNESDYLEAVLYLPHMPPQLRAKVLNGNNSVNGLQAPCVAAVTRQGEVRYYVNEWLVDHLSLEIIETKYTVTKLAPGVVSAADAERDRKRQAKLAIEAETEKVKSQLKAIDSSFDEEFDL